MEKLICVKETSLKGRGIFAVRDIRKGETTVSYTHLTLPTILRV